MKVYEVSFDFTVVKKGSNFIGKSGVIELTSDNDLSEDEITKLKTDKNLLHNIGFDLAQNLNQKNIFSVTIKDIQPKK